jgi:hypothetical protein
MGDGRLVCPASAKRGGVPSQAQAREKAATISNWLAVGNLSALVGLLHLHVQVHSAAGGDGTQENRSRAGRTDYFQSDRWRHPPGLFLLFIWGVSLWKDIRRVYEYHGAEHKTVFAFENGDPLTTSAVQKYSTYHPRCGTSFLMTVMLISIGFYMLIPYTTFWARFASRIVLLAAHRRSFLRDHPLRGQTPRIALRAHDRSRPVAAAHYDAASVRRDGAVRHHRPRTSHGSRKERGGELVIA